jgi:hypothetical protein
LPTGANYKGKFFGWQWTFTKLNICSYCHLKFFGLQLFWHLPNTVCMISWFFLHCFQTLEILNF